MTGWGSGSLKGLDFYVPRLSGTESLLSSSSQSSNGLGPFAQWQHLSCEGRACVSQGPRVVDGRGTCHRDLKTLRVLKIAVRTRVPSPFGVRVVGDAPRTVFRPVSGTVHSRSLGGRPPSFPLPQPLLPRLSPKSGWTTASMIVKPHLLRRSVSTLPS